MRLQPYHDIDPEAGPVPIELGAPELHCFFIAKVYTIISIQLLVTVAVAATVNFVHPITNFILHTKAGLALYIVIIIIPFIVICPLYYYYRLRPVNYLLLGVFTTALGFLVGLTCAFTSGKVILESAILTAVAVVNLTLYTFWAAKRGHDFSFLGPFLFSAFIVLLLFSLVQIFLPLGKITKMIYGCLASILFCGYIIYDTDNLIKRYSYDGYIWAAVSLYLDIINIFFSLLTFFSAQD
ncbi:protein LIFEGUARD 2 [Ricinus communis]|uniref:protein LIFEGUARD 2 n=1 Tax=Ricinus communis TaxID=3988 RepID=UPI0007728202|nr:protein LIFEGUARD 2 [Ricinus communis]|eukprot:XP_015578207.1 protein LIFEGUARD 2 [Ricinus communis]